MVSWGFVAGGDGAEVFPSAAVPARASLSVWVAKLGVSELVFEEATSPFSQSIVSLRKPVVACGRVEESEIWVEIEEIVEKEDRL